MAVDHSSPPLQVGDPYRQLRVMAICGFVPALSLLLPCGILTAKVLPALGIAPMFFSAAFQLATIGARPRFPKATVCINLFLATFLFSVLLPSWIFMGGRHLEDWRGADYTMLGAYGTMPLMINLVIHLHLALQTFFTTDWYRAFTAAWYRPLAPGCCCNSAGGCLRAERIEIPTHDKDGIEAHEPIMRFCDDHARPSSEFQTSGFNTPRTSQETLGSSVRKSDDLL